MTLENLATMTTTMRKWTYTLARRQFGADWKSMPSMKFLNEDSWRRILCEEKGATFT
jgi:hypothetical protein